MTGTWPKSTNGASLPGKSNLAESGTAPTTINRDVNALRAMLSYAEEKGVLSVHPLKGLKPLAVEEDERVRYLESDEEKRLLNSLDARRRRNPQRA